ncbi:hypothetical protein PENTCL1PPCAC_11854, partial [Pristionchus entomophagus]
AILSSSLRESRLVVLFYRPSSGQSEEMEALDFIFHQSMDIVESSGETVHWIRDEPFSRLPAMASIPHPAALNLLKLHYAGDQILECLSHVQNEAAPKEDGSYVIEFGGSPCGREIAAVLASLQASLDFSPSSHLNGEENDQPSMGPCALVVLPYSSTRAHVASMYTDVMWSFNENNEFKSLTYWDEQFVRSEE